MFWKRWFKVITPCPAANETIEEVEKAPDEGAEENELRLISRDFIIADDGDLVNSGIEIDDDTLPAPETIPRTQDANNNSIREEIWKDTCVCPRRAVGAGNRSARLL